MPSLKISGLPHVGPRQGARAGQVIRGIRDMVKKGNAARKPVDLNRLVLDVVRLTKSNAVSCSCTLITDLEPGLPPVHADPVQLQQVLLNLVLNAFEAMHETPIQARRLVLSTKADANRSLVHTMARDFGPGRSWPVRRASTKRPTLATERRNKRATCAQGKPSWSTASATRCRRSTE